MQVRAGSRVLLTFVRTGVMDLAAMVGIEAGERVEFDHIGDGMLRLRKA